MKILILKPSSLGDVVQAMPVLRLLKLHWQESEIHWWIDSALADLLEGDPDLNGIVRFERRRWAAPRNWAEVLRSVAWMRRQEFDLVIDLQGLARSGAFAWLARGKLLVGLDEPREGARGYYDIIVRRASYHTHAVDWYLGILQMLGVPVHRGFDWLPARPEVAEQVRMKWGTDSARWIAVQPGARWENKRWSPQYFAELIRELAWKYPDHRFVILGADADRDAGKAISQVSPMRCLDLTGKSTLKEMVEWIRLSDLLICNDSGPMHIAAALGKPLVAIFGPTEPRRTGPYGQLESAIQTKLACVPCMKSSCANPVRMECLQAISPDQVESKVSAVVLRLATEPRGRKVVE